MERLFWGDLSEISYILSLLTDASDFVALEQTCKAQHLWRRAFCCRWLVLAEELKLYEDLVKSIDWKHQYQERLASYKAISNDPEGGKFFLHPETAFAEDNITHLFEFIRSSRNGEQPETFQLILRNLVYVGTAYIDHVTKQPTEDVALEQVEAIYEVVGLMSYYFRTKTDIGALGMLSFFFYLVRAPDPFNREVLRSAILYDQQFSERLIACNFLECIWEYITTNDAAFEEAYDYIKFLSFDRRDTVGTEMLPRMWEYFTGLQANPDKTERDEKKFAMFSTFLADCVRSDKNRVIAVELGAIPFFANLLFHPDIQISISALCGLGNLANAGEKVRRAFAFSDCFPLMLKYLKVAVPYAKCFILNFFATLSMWQTIPEDVQKLMREFIESEHLTSELQKGMNEGYICIDVDDVGYLKCDTIPVICKLWGLYVASNCPRNSSEDWSVITPITENILSDLKPKHYSPGYGRLFPLVEEHIANKWAVSDNGIDFDLVASNEELEEDGMEGVEEEDSDTN